MVNLNPVDPSNHPIIKPADQKPKTSFMGKIGKLASSLFASKPKPNAPEIDGLVQLEVKKNVQAAAEPLFPVKAKQLLEAIGVSDLETAGELSIHQARGIMEMPEVREYLTEGEDRRTLQILTNIAFRANYKGWEEVDHEMEVKGLNSQCAGEKALYEADILRTPDFILNDEKIPREERFVRLKEFAGDDAYAALLSNAVQQGLLSSLNMKVSMVYLPFSMSLGATEHVTGGVQELVINREADGELLLEATVKFPISRIPSMQHIMNIFGTVEVKISEEDFKKRDFNKAEFTFFTSASTPDLNESDDFNLV